MRARRLRGRTNVWWTSVLFSIGSACFALGSVPGYASLVGVTPDAVTFFVGSIFFTSAGYLQYAGSGGPASDPPRFRPPLHPPGAVGWAALIQLAGTLWFNVSTFHAIVSNLSAAQADQLVWRPDVEGSICFLVASTIVLAVISRSTGRWRPRSRDWSAAALNMAGSVAFGISAIAAYVVPDSGQMRNAALVNLGTFVGALCFLVAALILLPRRSSA